MNMIENPCVCRIVCCVPQFHNFAQFKHITEHLSRLVRASMECDLSKIYNGNNWIGISHGYKSKKNSKLPILSPS